jgi:restriction system protein
MTKARLLSTTGRGKFVITELGQELLNTNPPRIDLSVLMHYQAFREFYKRDSDTQTATLDFGSSGESAAAEEKTPLEQIEIAHQKIHAGVRADLLDRILQNSPAFFEQVIVDLLVAMGYGGTHKNAAAQLGRSGDGGVDGVINEDRLGLDRVYVQAKRYADATVSRPDVQSFVGSLVGFGATKGVFVTTSAFSAQAREYVKNLPQRVILLDGQKLVELMIEHNVGVRTSTVLELKALDENFFDEDR